MSTAPPGTQSEKITSCYMCNLFSRLSSVGGWPSVTKFTFCQFYHQYSKRSIRYANMSRSGDQTNLLLCRESNPVSSFVMLRPLNVTSKLRRTVWSLPQNNAESNVGTGGCARVGSGIVRWRHAKWLMSWLPSKIDLGWQDSVTPYKACSLLQSWWWSCSKTG